MSKRSANLLFLLATIGWGSSYLFTKFAVHELNSFSLIVYRFGIAFILGYMLFYKKLVHTSKRVLGASAVLGLMMCMMFAVFHHILKTVDPATASFLLATTVLLVPFINTIFTKRLPARQIVVGASITIIGLFIFIVKQHFTFDDASIICIGASVLFACHLVVNNRFAARHDALQLGIYQLGFAALFAAVVMFMYEGVSVPQTTVGWSSILFLAAICSTFGFVVQSVAQKYTSAEETGFILALEPLVSAAMAYVILGQTFTEKQWVGAIILLLGVCVAIYEPKYMKKSVFIKKEARL